jgi:uncharacterized caspase-like protein
VTMPDRRWALLVGASKYDFFTSLKYSADDAADFAAALRDNLGFTSDTMLLLSDGPAHAANYKPTRASIFHALASLAKSDSPYYVDNQLDPIQEDDLFVFYFSGHGLRAPNGDEYLLSVDASDQSISDTAVNLGELAKQIANLPCRHKILFIDACRSEFDEEGAKDPAPPPGIGDLRVDREGIATFYSCDPRHRSYEIDDLKHGSFTYCLLEAVSDPTVNSLGELNAYLTSRVPGINAKGGKRAQKPFLIPNPADMLDLRLFAAQEQKVDLDELMDLANAALENEIIEYELWDQLTTFLADAKQGGGTNVKIRTKLLHLFFRNDLNVEELVARWQRTERPTAPVRESKPQVHLALSGGP